MHYFAKLLRILISEDEPIFVFLWGLVWELNYDARRGCINSVVFFLCMHARRDDKHGRRKQNKSTEREKKPSPLLYQRKKTSAIDATKFGLLYNLRTRIRTN